MATCGSSSFSSGVSPGLGFLHLSTTTAHVGSGGVRGAPKGEASASSEECCAKCGANPSCTVWLQRAEGKCYLGNCSASASLPCLERMRSSAPQAGQQPTAGASPSENARTRTLLCTRPPAKSAKSPKSGGDASGLALLLLGHRGRLMFTTLCSNVVKPVVSSGVPVDLFAFLENSTMAKAFRGRRPMGNPAFAQLGDKELAARVAADVSAHGGRIASIRIGPRPVVELPANRPERLSRYTEHVKRTVATRFLKERLGYEMVQAYEAANDKRYAWVLWTREDSHWFKPLDLSLFKRGAVHGKACGGFGGWNDKVWLMDREWAGPMLSMYDDFHMDHPAKCTDLAHSSSNGVDSSSRGGGGGPLSVDFLAAPSVEQFRERVGKLRRIPFTKHTPEDLPTMDSYYREKGSSSGGGGSDWMLCFPKIYAKGCVPAADQTRVDTEHACA